ncbi:MAG: tetratricopeptide repeat protein [Methylophilaceae bacterium]
MQDRDEFLDARRLREAGKLPEAEGAYQRLLQRFPRSDSILNALAEVSLSLRKFDASIELLGRSLRLKPDQPIALMLLGLALREVARTDAALECLDRAIALRPGYATALFHRAQLLQAVKRFDDAIASFDRAIEAKPDYAAALVGRGQLLADLNRYDEALASCERAIAAKPGYTEAHYVKAELLLLRGDFEQGWELYERRWDTKARSGGRQFARCPLWSGEPIAGKTLLIHPEVGLGDFVMFSRFFPLIGPLGAKVVVHSPPALAALLASSFDGVTVIPKGNPVPPVDVQCPIMSLPRAFKMAPETIPAGVPYLRTAPQTQARWLEALGQRGRLARIGLVWSGKADRAIDRSPLKNRSLPLALLAPWLQLPFEFHSLQREILPDDADTLAALGRIKDHRSELDDFSDTAALAGEMDLVISIDTSVAHVAGALGKKLWVLLPYSSDYRWPRGNGSTPWYPTATLFRQNLPGDWPEVVARVTDCLSDFANGISS